MIRIIGKNACTHGLFGAVDQPERAEVTAGWAVWVNTGQTRDRRCGRSAVVGELGGAEQIASTREGARWAPRGQAEMGEDLGKNGGMPRWTILKSGARISG